MSVAKELRVLRAARELIADPERWTQGEYARDADGKPVDDGDERAVRWCATGAIWRTAPSGSVACRTIQLAAEVARRAHDMGLMQVNDRLGHQAVLRVLDQAIAAAEAEKGER
jgi:hypothetical protein